MAKKTKKRGSSGFNYYKIAKGTKPINKSKK